MLPMSPADGTFGALRPEHREVGVGVGRGEHDLLGALGRQPHHRDHDVDLVGEQEGDAVGAGDLLHLELHAERLGDHLGELDVEALGLALLVLTEPKGGTSSGTAMRTTPFREDVLELVGALRGRRPDERQAERHHGKAVEPKSPDPPHRIFLPSWSGVGRR